MLRMRVCSKRVCTLLTPQCHRIKEQSSRNLEALHSRHYQNRNQAQWSKTRWANLIAAGIIAASVSESKPDNDTAPKLEEREKVDEAPEDNTEAAPNDNALLPVDPAPPKRVLDYLDSLYDSQQFKELAFSLKRFEDLNNAEMLWRRARALWEVLEIEGKRRKTSEIQVAVDLIDRALELDPTNYNVHRWKAILSNDLTSTMGMRYQFQNLDTMKHHLEKAIELNPSDATAYTLLGTWHVELMELSWYEKKFATTFLGDMPDCSYEEALRLFLKAEEVKPKAWNRNLMLISKVYLSLGDRWKSKEYVEMVLDLEVVIDDDKLILEEAEKFYRKHFVLSV